MRIYLVRHATSESNQKATYSDPDTLLGPHAEQELRAVRRYLQTKEFSEVYTSPLRRTVRTAEILGFPDAQRERRLAERNFGIFIGHTHKECEVLFPEEYANYMQDSVGYSIPEGESFLQVCDRVWRFLDELTEKERSAVTPIEGFRPRAGDPRNILLVCHFNILNAALCWVMESPYLGHHLITENGGVLCLDSRGRLKTLSIERRR